MKYLLYFALVLIVLGAILHVAVEAKGEVIKETRDGVSISFITKKPGDPAPTEKVKIDAEGNVDVDGGNVVVSPGGKVQANDFTDSAGTGAPDFPNNLKNNGTLLGTLATKSSVGQAEIQTDGVAAAEIEAGAVGVSEIGPNAVGNSELQDTITVPTLTVTTINFGVGGAFKVSRYTGIRGASASWGTITTPSNGAIYGVTGIYRVGENTTPNSTWCRIDMASYNTSSQGTNSQSGYANGCFGTNSPIFEIKLLSNGYQIQLRAINSAGGVNDQMEYRLLVFHN
jgi:hypothetical protein